MGVETDKETDMNTDMNSNMDTDAQGLEERYALAVDRIREIPKEQSGEGCLEKGNLQKFFVSVAEFLLTLDDTKTFLEKGGLNTAPIEELSERNHRLYEDILPENYEKSYANPAYAVQELGEEYGAVLSALYARERGVIEDVYEGRLESLVIHMELFLEVYASFVYAVSEGASLPGREDVRKMIYWFMSDYADLFSREDIRNMVCPNDSFGIELIMESDLADVRYLYAYGAYVGENELATARFLAGLPEETIAMMADTYTEGYRIGFEVTGKDLSKKKTARIYYHLGFERMMRRAVENLEKMGLKPIAGQGSFEGSNPNRQFGYDHKDDRALFLDKQYVNRKLEAMRAGFEEYKEQAGGYAGPAVVETFGEADFNPVNKKEALHLSPEQNKLWVEYRTQMGMIQREYILAEERSFTIIAFPVPEVGPVFEELFRETIRINTLDYMLYRNIQQKLIDALDQADYCEIRGRGGNRTDLRVNLYKLADPAKETIFENCVADVNIPVGEVFTSPVLEGTEGLLHVSRVFLDGLEYRDLSVAFKDGMISDYNCSNFESGEENRNFIKENILFRHDTLPLGEFAIGTNTTAYVAAKRLGVEGKLPILIAEKMGPHFAVGDTCYSHTEDIRVYNPDGKEIVAKSNAVADLRHTKPEEAYLNCHTDITIPYDELGELTAVKKDGTRIVIIQNGRFVLPGCEELNKAFENV